MGVFSGRAPYTAGVGRDRRRGVSNAMGTLEERMACRSRIYDADKEDV